MYARISADREGLETGVERQEQDCRRLADRLGLDVVRVYVENDVSASTRSRKPRPKYEDMLTRARAGEFDAILAYSNSRLTRRPREVEDLLELVERYGVRVVTVVSGEDNLATADGRMTARIKGNVDTAEAERTAERVARAKLQAVEEGRYRGGRRPFGYEADGVTVRPAEAAVVLSACRGLLAGRSLAGMAREAAADGVTTTGGVPMDAVSLRRIIRRPRNAGLMEHRGEIVGSAIWPAIVPEDVWRAAVGVLDDPVRRTTTTPQRRWLGSGLYRCAVCGVGVRGTAAGSGRRAYRCVNGAHVSRDLDTTDALVRATIAGRLGREDVRDLLDVGDPGDREGEALRARAEAARARLARFEGDYAAGLIDGRQLADATARARAELEQVTADLAERARHSVLGGPLASPDPAQAFLSAPLDVQRAVLDALAVVTIEPAPKGRPAGWRPGEGYAEARVRVASETGGDIAEAAGVRLEWRG